MEVIYLAGGCFWCIEPVFDSLKGVNEAVSGYIGDTRFTEVNYDLVSSGKTDFAECVKVEFDSSIISLEKILEVFFAVHDPTTLNKQGFDVGTMYRSEIFVTNKNQENTAIHFLKKLNSEKFSGQIVTKISVASNFFSAEDYHQKFFIKNPNYPYCANIINPKISKFYQNFKDLLKDEAK